MPLRSRSVIHKSKGIRNNLIEGLPAEVGEYRVVGIHNYLVFYRVTANHIFVDRILYKRRDYLPLLGLQ